MPESDKPSTPTIPDQSDVVAANERLTTSVADLTAKLKESTTALIALEATLAKSKAALVESEAALASANAEVAKLKPLAESATKQAAAQVAQAGIVKTEVPKAIAPTSQTKVKVNYTELAKAELGQA